MAGGRALNPRYPALEVDTLPLGYGAGLKDRGLKLGQLIGDDE